MGGHEIPAPLDEPSKLEQILVPMSRSDPPQEVTLSNGSVASLLLGATDQDDCAAYTVKGDQVLVAGSDYVRGPKFRLYEDGWLNDYDIGWYLAGANLSDIAAMGAAPLGLLSVVRYPKNLPDSSFRDLLRGIRDSCASVGALNVGGDIGGAERIILSASAFGTVEPDGLLTRRGARQGQTVCVTGPTGLAGAVMQLSAAGRVTDLSSAHLEELLVKWRRVRPRVSHGRLFAAAAGVTSCIDTSDGLKGAIHTIAESSGVGIVVDATWMSVHPAVHSAAEILAVDPWTIVFGDSVDFELVCTIDDEDVSSVANACARQGLELVRIGKTIEGTGVSWRTPHASTELPGVPWRH